MELDLLWSLQEYQLAQQEWEQHHLQLVSQYKDALGKQGFFFVKQMG